MIATIILPTYNERENIVPLIEAICRVLDGRDFEILVVDDDSPDGTWKLVEEAAARDSRVRLLRRMNERGLTSALNAGIAAARGDAVAWLDCDFQHPPEKLAELLDAIDAGADLAIGSRFMRSAAGETGDRRLELRAEASTIIKVHGFLSKLLSKMTSFVLRSGYSDWTSGLIAVRKSVFETQKLEGSYGEYYMFLLHRSAKLGYKIAEIPYVLNRRESGSSKTSATYAGMFVLGLKYLRTLVRLVNDPFVAQQTTNRRLEASNRI